MTSALVFARPRSGRVKVSASAAQTLDSFRQMGRRDEEAGGVLLGRFIRGTADIVIDLITMPMTGDVRSRFAFRRDAKRHQTLIDEAWASSEGTCLYLGEWHTHPERVPTPSSVDLSDWRRRLKEDEFDGEILIFLIVGIDVTCAWEGNSASRRISRLEAVTNER